jgi:hypothetical protein
MATFSSRQAAACLQLGCRMKLVDDRAVSEMCLRFRPPRDALTVPTAGSWVLRL